MLSPCPNKIQVKETLKTKYTHPPSIADCTFQDEETGKFGATVFDRSPDDEKVALSVDDQTFLDIMNKEVYMDNVNNWVAYSSANPAAVFLTTRKWLCDESYPSDKH